MDERYWNLLSPPPSGWFALVEGDDDPTAMWIAHLTPPAATRLFRHGDGRLMLTVAREDASFEEARREGMASVARINGAISLAESARAMIFKGMVHIDGGGVAVEYNGADVQLRADPVRTHSHVECPPEIRQPTEVSKWLRLAESNPPLEGILRLVAPPLTWFNVYMATEAAKDICPDIRARMGRPSRWETMRATANRQRHWKAYDPPSPLSLHECEQELAGMVRVLVAEIESREAAVAEAHTPTE